MVEADTQAAVAARNKHVKRKVVLAERMLFCSMSAPVVWICVATIYQHQHEHEHEHSRHHYHYYCSF